MSTLEDMPQSGTTSSVDVLIIGSGFRDRDGHPTGVLVGVLVAVTADLRGRLRDGVTRVAGPR